MADLTRANTALPVAISGVSGATANRLIVRQSGFQMGCPPNITTVSGYGNNHTFGTQVVMGLNSQDARLTNTQGSIKGGSAADAPGGAGIEQVEIYYLDENFNGPFTEIMTLNGTTPVLTVATNICYIDRIQILKGSASSGQAFFYYNTTATGGIAASVGFLTARGFGFHWVPAGKTCYITSVSASIQTFGVGLGGVVFLKYRYAGADYVFDLVGNFTHEILQLKIITIRNPVTHIFASPVKIVGPAKIGLTCLMTDGVFTPVVYSGSFTYFEL
jgi:hypothetical protein